MIINYGICGAIIFLLIIVILMINSVDNQLRKLNDNFKSMQQVIDHINYNTNAIDKGQDKVIDLLQDQREIYSFNKLNDLDDETLVRFIRQSIQESIKIGY